MPKKYIRKGKQTHPDIAGPQNISAEYIAKRKVTGKEAIMVNGTAKLFERSQSVKGTNWTGEEMQKAIIEYFGFCAEYSIKPSKASLGLYLGANKDTIGEWTRNSAKYGIISVIIKEAVDAIESSYISSGEEKPAMNIFLLKTSHGHIESSKLDITSDGKQLSDASDVRNAVSRLNLDK